jgi:glutamate--cysteine ligase
VGIQAQTMRFLDVFLMHCLLQPSPPDTPDEIAALARNQQRTAARGREPGLRLEQGYNQVLLTDWGQRLLDECEPIAQALDAVNLGGNAGAEACSNPAQGCHAAALQAARMGLTQPDSLPSARVLAAMAQHNNSFSAFTQAQSVLARQHLLGLPYAASLHEQFVALSKKSVQEQKQIEANDSLPFEMYRQQYVSPNRLGAAREAAPALAYAV